MCNAFIFRYFYNKVFGYINNSHISSSSHIGKNVILSGHNLISPNCEIEKCTIGYFL